MIVYVHFDDMKTSTQQIHEDMVCSLNYNSSILTLSLLHPSIFSSYSFIRSIPFPTRDIPSLSCLNWKPSSCRKTMSKRFQHQINSSIIIYLSARCSEGISCCCWNSLDRYSSSTKHQTIPELKAFLSVTYYSHHWIHRLQSALQSSQSP